MALTGTDRGTGTHNTSATSFTLNPGSNFTAGALAVICLSVDNAGTSGGLLSTFTVTDTLGNTWTRRSSPIYDPGAANAGVEGAFFTTPQNGGTLQTGTTITVSFGSTAVVAKVWTLMEVSSDISGVTPTYKNQGVGTGSATTTPTVTSASIGNGQMIIGGVFNEYGTAQTPTGDSDTTNGNWSTMQTNEIGTTTAGQTIITQRKVVSAAGTQTYNPTLGTSSDVIAAWISIGENITISSGVGSVDLTGLVPTATATNNQLVTAGLGQVSLTGFVSTIINPAGVTAESGSVSLTGFAPTVTASDHQIVSIGLGAIDLNGLIPSVNISDNQTANALLGEITLTGFEPTITIESPGTVVNTGLGQLDLSGFIPTVSVSDNQLIQSLLGQIDLGGYSPIVTASDHQTVNCDYGILTLIGFETTITIGGDITIEPCIGNIIITSKKPIASNGYGGILKRWDGYAWLPIN